MTAASEAFLTGGSGLVGGHLLDRLVASGVSVKALVRSDEAEDKVSRAGGTPVRGDLFAQESLAAEMRGTEIVFHVAGVNDPCPRDVASMDRINVDGTRSVIRAAAGAGVRKVVFTSSAAVIGERRGSVGMESTPHSGSFLSPYARSKYRAELAAFEEGEEQGIDVVAVNPSSVQGPGRASGSAAILLRVLNSRRPILVDTHVSIVDIEDCTDGHLAAAARGKPGERYLLTAPALRTSDAVEMACDITKRAIRPRWVPVGFVGPVGIPLAFVAKRVRPASSICPALVRTLAHGHRFDATKAVTDLEMTFRSARNTFERTIDWYIARGLVADI